jgi:hypothetical protein
MTRIQSIMRRKLNGMKYVLGGVVLLLLPACAGVTDVYRDSSMDFGSIRTVVIMPFGNLSRDSFGADRVRDVFATVLMANSGIYVVPPGEVARGIAIAGIGNPTSPTADEVVKLCKSLKADAVFTGVLREYGEVRAGTSTANTISLSMQLIEGQTGKVVWSASTTKGGIGFEERMLGGGGQPLNVVTEKAVYELINKLFQ